jgi:hypothetical protein
MKTLAMFAVLGSLGITGPAWTFDFGMVGIVAGQTARLSIVNTLDSPELPCSLVVMFLDSEGDVVKGPEIRTLRPGHATFLDYGNPNLRQGERLEIRALVEVNLDSPATHHACRRFIPAVEVFDNLSGITTVRFHWDRYGKKNENSSLFGFDPNE